MKLRCFHCDWGYTTTAPASITYEHFFHGCPGPIIGQETGWHLFTLQDNSMWIGDFQPLIIHDVVVQEKEEA